MNKHRKAEVHEPAFTMAKGDRFHKIIVSAPLRFALMPDTTTVITFIVIRRAAGTFSISNIIKTSKDGRLFSRSVQEKSPIAAKNFEKELAKIQTNFTQGVQAQTNCKVDWSTLDLAHIESKVEQLQAIKAWGKLNVC